MPYTTITTEGGLLPADILDAVAAGELEGQRAEDFGFDRGRNLTDEIAAAWAAVRGAWQTFKFLRDNRLREGDPGTSLTRERWVAPLLDVLGYQLSYNQAAYVIEGRTYAISHRAGAHADAPPVHVEGIRASLDARPPSGRPRLSPHALLQEYLNSTEQLWGIVTNGERLRLLRDSSRFTRPTYVEFDLRAMLEGEHFAEFAIFYRLLHRSRLPATGQDAATCRLERYHQLAVESGGRVREKLRDGVETALRTLGDGLLRHPANQTLRAKVAESRLTPLAYYRQLLRLVYRLLFLMVAEERGLIAAGTRRLTATEDDPFEIASARSFDALLSSLVLGPSSSDRLKIYYEHYSVGRLRRLAEQPGAGRGPYDDLWMGLQSTFRLLEGSDEQSPRSLGLAALGGDLFGAEAIADLEGQRLRNADLLAAIRALSLYREKESKALRRVNYGALDVEELGSVYESLLDYRPVVAVHEYATNTRIEDSAHSSIRGQFVDGMSFDLVAGTERKTTGSYYTRPELVHELIKSALVPVIEERLKAATNDQRPTTNDQRTSTGDIDSRSSFVVRRSSAEQALLSIRVVDPACGSGHFLLAAARRLGRELARVRSGEEQPTPTDFRRAVRDVIQHCIYGVDLNPLAVDLCKLALWIEGHNAGMPLSFLDHHIKQGNSLIGATRALVDAGIPDDAYKPVTSDDKPTASAIRKRNKQERELAEQGMRQPSLFDAPMAQGGPSQAEALDRLDATADDSVAAVRAKAARYRALRDEIEAERARFDLWTAAFFQPLTPANAQSVPTTKDLLDLRIGDIKTIQAEALAGEVGFFHWELEFPQVFEPTNDQRPMTNEPERSSFVVGRSSGFDVVLGNPPWERIKLQEQEHWVDVVEVRDAPNKAAREKMIQAWRNGDERQRARVAQFDAAKYRAEAESRFVRASGRFPLTAVGDVNTYALFAEHARDLLAPTGRAGVIVPLGVATDDTTKVFFGDLMFRRHLVRLIGFDNERFIFPEVNNKVKFCTITMMGSAGTHKAPQFAFSCQEFQDVQQEERLFSLSFSSLELLNPNTRTCPIFRTKKDAFLTEQIYERFPVLHKSNSEKTWPISFSTMFHMANDSGLFKTQQDLINNRIELRGNIFVLKDLKYLPLYEAKMIWHFDHRFASLIGRDAAGDRPSRKYEGWYGVIASDPTELPMPQYWLAEADIAPRILESNGKTQEWLLVFRDISSSYVERTAVFSVIPKAAVGHTMPIVSLHGYNRTTIASCLLSCINSLTFDYIVRQKMGGSHLTYAILNQLPVLPPTAFSAEDIAFIVPRVLELVYTAWDMRPFAEDVWGEATNDQRPTTTDRRPATNNSEDLSGAAGGATGGDQTRRGPHLTGLGDEDDDNRDEDLSGAAGGATGGDQTRRGPHLTGLGVDLRAEILRRNAECNAGAPEDLFAPRDGFVLPPFRWNDQRRALIRAELDARIARLYGLTRDELRYILDPADVYGPDFPGETFRVLKEKEIKQFGEYRTRRLVLEAWDRERAGHE